jgi:hypothetical protein
VRRPLSELCSAALCSRPSNQRLAATTDIAAHILFGVAENFGAPRRVDAKRIVTAATVIPDASFGVAEDKGNDCGKEA